MYRVLIVDDEPWALVVIRKIFNWEENGFEVIGETTSSKKAIDIISSEHPDVVFTDIRMPNFDGIELIKIIRQKKIDTEFIIISGFAEFSYALEAIHNGALDYCLKPMDPSKTDELLKKIYVYLENKRSLQNNELMEVIKGTSGRKSAVIDDFLHKYTQGVWFSMVVYSENENDNVKNSKGLEGYHLLGIKVGVNKYQYIVNMEDNAASDKMEEELFKKPDIISAGISTRVEKAEDFQKLVKEADIAALKTFVSGEKGVFFYTNNIQILKPVLNKISNAVTNRKFELLQGILEELQELFVVQGLGMSEVIYFWNQIVSIMDNKFEDKSTYFNLEFLNYSELCTRFKDFKSLCGYLQEVFNELGPDKVMSLCDQEINASFIKMVEYIKANFSQELYLKELAVKFYINQFYCCELFKKFIGKTFSEFIASLRTEKACELMVTTDLSIERVAEIVGYNDYYYFNKVFKKYCGMPPAKYRKNHTK
ncbi:response regulator transcription factor [Ruminiclostridium cellobioparum]|uniref:Stage 0 sporulation protein A homolog n=1 Tax=Ruminiclostridium cellobioparum subsp. termitidis CT1112 TaxID=1195236 RepID=S0FHL5_RUMCE|nr:response regulator [Ruminiclostridium cellobioparum]EMS69396.1 two component transcriptional regulator, AraC family protein [Ruminiclostridium cellobioparum subsp. termitidis CT1112]